MLRPLTVEQKADAATLAVVALAFLVMLFFELRNTWKWDSLGRALTVLTGCLLVSYTFAFISLVTTLNIWVPALRWSIRIVITASCIAVIVVLIRGRPPEREAMP